MTRTTSLHHSCRIYGIKNEQVSFEIAAQKRYDKKKPVAQPRSRRSCQPEVVIGSKPRTSKANTSTNNN